MLRKITFSKWEVLCWCCILGFGAYYHFDTPSALHNQMLKYYQPYYTSIEFEFYFSMMYSLYSLPNTILPLIGGLLVDSYGNNTILFYFSTFVLLGIYEKI